MIVHVDLRRMSKKVKKTSVAISFSLKEADRKSIFQCLFSNINVAKRLIAKFALSLIKGTVQNLYL